MPHTTDKPAGAKVPVPSNPIDLEKRILKLRWIGQDEEAAGLCSQLARIAPNGGTALWPRDTD